MPNPQKLNDSDVRLILKCMDERLELRRLADLKIKEAKELRDEADLLTNIKLAEKYEVSKSTIGHIATARRWSKL